MITYIELIHMVVRGNNELEESSQNDSLTANVFFYTDQVFQW